MIPGEYREWHKRITNAIWKNEILNSHKLEELFYYNFSNEFDWVKSLKFISNRHKLTFQQCEFGNSQECTYKIKNLLKDLPMYQMLFKRGTVVPDHISSSEEINWKCRLFRHNKIIKYKRAIVIYIDQRST